VIGGERTKLQVTHIKLSHNRAFLVRAYLLQTHKMLFDAQVPILQTSQRSYRSSGKHPIGPPHRRAAVTFRAAT
jgi:hypothetical protein